MTRVAVPAVTFCQNKVLRQELLAKYPDAKFNDAGAILKGDALVDFLRGYEKVLTGLEILDDAVLSKLPELKVVSKYGVGVDMIDLESMRRRGIKVGWRGGVNKRSVAELVIGLAISLLRHIPETHNRLRQGEWYRPAGRQLSDRTVGIIGCGHVGKEVVRLLSGFGSRVLVHDLRTFPEFYAQYKVQSVSLEDLLRQADVVTLHTPLDPTTSRMINRERLALMRSDAILINCARGGLIDDEALKMALKTGQIAAAGIDAFLPEPPTDREMIALPNLMGTPHMGASAEEAILAMGRAAIAGLDDYGDPIEVTSRMG
jgi:phosphoglycerate dehydrogenase-like enzyme